MIRKDRRKGLEKNVEGLSEFKKEQPEKKGKAATWGEGHGLGTLKSVYS